MDIEVRVPATVANLGPGFDCLGVAVGIYRRVVVSPPGESPSADSDPASSELTRIAFNAAFEAAGREPPQVEITPVEQYTSGRGLGSSAAEIVAGLVAARISGELQLSDAELARLAVKIEGHSDNVLPAMFGGLVVSGRNGWIRFAPTSEIGAVLLVAREEFKTEDSRRVLPAEVPRTDAVANAAATATLVAVLTGNTTPDSLMLATEDLLHEPYRLPLMPETLDVRHELRSRGIAVALAGAGPSLLALAPSARIVDVRAAVEEILPRGWWATAPKWDTVGAQVR